MLTRSAVIETLRKSNRLLDVKCILYDIIERTEGYGGDLPVRPCIDDNKLITHVKSKDVYSEARHLFEMLSSLSIPDDSKEICVGPCMMHGDEYSNLSLYVSDHSDMLLHNYAVEVSHRMGGEMNDEIRVWCVLSNLLDNMYSDEWDVPAGWCRKE